MYEVGLNESAATMSYTWTIQDVQQRQLAQEPNTACTSTQSLDRMCVAYCRRRLTSPLGKYTGTSYSTSLREGTVWGRMELCLIVLLYTKQSSFLFVSIFLYWLRNSAVFRPPLAKIPPSTQYQNMTSDGDVMGRLEVMWVAMSAVVIRGESYLGA